VWSVRPNGTAAVIDCHCSWGCPWAIRVLAIIPATVSFGGLLCIVSIIPAIGLYDCGGVGIAGSALATVMAGDGCQVVVLERQTAYRDKVRGEVLVCWGVAELLRLDLEKALLDAGGCYISRDPHFEDRQLDS
jgi:hypothetical protein